MYLKENVNMQVFVIGEVIETAKALDRLRLNKQITEARLLLDSLHGKNGWNRQPISKMYKGCDEWLDLYIKILRSWRDGRVEEAEELNKKAELLKPSWFCEDFYIKHRRRLYTKNPIYYKQWEKYGTSYSNWYRVDGVWKEYIQKE